LITVAAPLSDTPNESPAIVADRPLVIDQYAATSFVSATPLLFTMFTPGAI
jgi:hypothetical protein